METIKLNITIDKDWIEATWTKEVTTINEIEKEVEVDGELIKEIVQEESVTTEQIHCESFSGHREHITLLRAKAKEFNTSLKEFEPLIKECEDAFIYPTDKEIAKEELNNKIQEAKIYLASTDYKMTIDYFATLTKEIQDELILKRAESRKFIRDNQ